MRCEGAAAAAAAALAAGAVPFPFPPGTVIALMLAAERALLSRALAVMRTAERAAFATFYHGPRGGGLNWSFARPLPKVRYLTNAYGLTPIRHRLMQYLVLPSAAARASLRDLSRALIASEVPLSRELFSLRAPLASAHN